MPLRRLSVFAAAAALPLLAAAPATAGQTHPTPTHPAPAPTWRDTAVRMFPTDALTVPDWRQLTGRRVNLPTTNCGTDCATITLLNQLDGFDLDPRISMTFDRDVDPAQVASDINITKISWPPTTTGVGRVVYDRATHTVYAHPRQQLDPDSHYLMTLRGSWQFSIFTTESATTGLLDMRRQLDEGWAYRRAGILDRRLHVDATVPAQGTTLQYKQDLGNGKTNTIAVPNTSATNAASYTFGSFQAPSWLNADTVIPQTPTGTSGPRVTGKEQLPFVLITPAGTPPPGGWPVAIFGHGFTGFDGNVFLAADLNAAKGIATIATDVVGHGYGPASKWEVTTSDHVTHEIDAHARGVPDQTGVISSTSDVSAPPQPAPDASVNDRDGLRQTVADEMSLVRAIGHGGVAGLRRTGVTYYGQSFGGIYGTMLGGVDPKVQVLALNVAGGPITEIARLSPSFRGLVAQDLQARGLLNSPDPKRYYFEEDLPLRNQPPVTDPAPGALAIQKVLAEETWLDRSGDATAYAPLLRMAPPPGSTPKQVIFQNAYGDQTVPNPTNYNLLSAGGLFDRESLYRNDKNTAVDSTSPTGATFAQENPHTFLLNPYNPASVEGQTQIVTFFLSGGTQVINPDPRLWEVPISDPAILESLNFAAPWA